MNLFLKLTLLGAIITQLACQPNSSPMKKDTTESSLAFLGTYTQKEGHVDGKGIGVGIYTTGPLAKDWKLQGQFSEIINPSYICLSPNHSIIYAVSEQGSDVPAPKSVIKVLSYNKEDFSIKELQSVSALGDAPCYISTDRSGKHLFIANYGTGNVVQYHIKADGTLHPGISTQHDGDGPDKRRQGGPHAHYVHQHPRQNDIYAVDLGSDQVIRYDATDQGLVPTGTIQVEPGSGCRHLVWHPVEDIVYIINEMSGTIESWKWEKDQSSRLQILSLVSSGEKGSPGAAAIDLSEDGRFLYASIRGDFNEIIVSKIDPTTHQLSIIQRIAAGGSAPRHIGLSKKENYLSVSLQNEAKIILFKRNAETGKLDETPEQVSVNSPVCVQFK